MRERITIDAGADLRWRDAPEGFSREVCLRLTGTIRDRLRRIDREVCLVAKEGGEYVAPRGAVRHLRAAAERRGLDLEWRSEVVSVGEAARAPVDLVGVTLRPYQEEAVEYLLRAVQGLILLPCGGGKTTIGVAALARLGEPALVVVPTVDLVDQWVERLGACGVEGSRLAEDRAVAPGEVIVSTAHAFAGGRGDLALSSVGVLLVDECHRAPAPLWEDTVARCAARFRWGLTATPERSDGLGFALPALFGEPFEAATTRDLIAGGWLRLPEVVGVSTGWSTPEDLFEASFECRACRALGVVTLAHFTEGANCHRCETRIGDFDVSPEGFRLAQYARALGMLCEDPERTALAVRLAARAADAGRRVLVLAARVALTIDISEALCREGFDAVGLSSKTPKGARREAIENLRTGRISILVATTLADEGLDVPDLDCVILAAPSRSSAKTKQRAGRAVRPSGQSPLILDLVDGDVFQSQWRARKSAYLREYGSECLPFEGLVEPEVALEIAGRS